jgi:hypothetical protein
VCGEGGVCLEGTDGELGCFDTCELPSGACLHGACFLVEKIEKYGVCMPPGTQDEYTKCDLPNDCRSGLICIITYELNEMTCLPPCQVGDVCSGRVCQNTPAGVRVCY